MENVSWDVSPNDTTRRHALLWAVALTSIAVEILRYGLHPEQYTHRAWPFVAAYVLANVSYHWWSLPNTQAKSVVSTVVGQAGLPALLQSLFDLAVAIAPALVHFLKTSVPGPQPPV